MNIGNKWTISPFYKSKNVQLQVELIYQSEQILKFKVTGRDSIIIQCDYPLIKLQNAKRKIRWTLREGPIKDGQLLKDIFYYLEEIVKGDDKKPYTYLDHPKNR